MGGRGRSVSAAGAVLLVLAACGASGEPQPDDGGPLDSARSSAAAERENRADPCRRKEHGRWHYSIGHCRAMAAPARLQGVWLHGFELSQFVPRARSFAEAAAREGQAHDIEADEAKVARLAGAAGAGARLAAYDISFIGRRTRDPFFVDCQGHAQFTIVVDRLIAARRLGVPPPRQVTRAELEAEMARDRAGPVTVAVRHGGKWGALEAEALTRCRRDRMRAMRGRRSGSPAAP